MTERIKALITRYKGQLEDTAFLFDTLIKEIEGEDYASARHVVDTIYIRLGLINSFLTSLRSALFRIQEEATREIPANHKKKRDVKMRYKDFLIDEVREICINVCGDILTPKHVLRAFHRKEGEEELEKEGLI